ncbi:hypothetical protein BUALT_Bualt02G0125600 [Buddleja alternifolia]|uniref:Phylloplanin n=1 Tax=Buddleja alternifolia TaxID=168488 RepID=A0AAV6YAH7_9LAMI|nr:hypothetical protein BUALT_Bualt02G0125600 [Buddleja alternifolia]
MAFRSSILLVIALLSVASTMSSAAIINSGILGGVLTCTNTSVSLAGMYSIIPQTRVDLVCGNGSLAQVVKSAVTNTAGVYIFSFTSLDTILNDPGKCYLTATIPATSCNFNIPSAILRFPIVVLSTVDALVGKLLVLAPGVLSCVISN